MSLSLIAIIIGTMAVVAGALGILKPEEMRRQMELFPRSQVPAWILTALCCYLGAKYAHRMHMGFLDQYKFIINILAPAVFIASVIYMKELLAPRALGGFLCLIAVPIVEAAKWHDSPWRLLIISVAYVWVIFGIVLLMSPWYYRKITTLILKNDKVLKYGSYFKAAVGVVIILLGFIIF